jgi:hypothetical protein
VEAAQVDAVVDHADRALGHAVPRDEIALDHLRDRDDAPVRAGRVGAALERDGQAVLEAAEAEPALPGLLDPAVRELDVGLVAAAAGADHVLPRRLPQAEHEVVVRPGQVPLDVARESPQPPARPQREAVQALEAHARVGRGLVPPADDDDLVSPLGEVGRQRVEEALGPAHGGVPLVHERDLQGRDGERCVG